MMHEHGSFDISPCPDDPVNDEDALREQAMNDDDDDWRGPLLPVSKTPISPAGRKYLPPVAPVALKIREDAPDNASLQDLADQLVIHRLLFLLYSQAHFLSSRDGGRQRFSRPYQLDRGVPWDRLFSPAGQDAAAILDYGKALDAHFRCCTNYVTNATRRQSGTVDANPLRRTLDESSGLNQLKWTVSEIGAAVLKKSSRRLLRTIGVCLTSIPDDSIRDEVSRVQQVAWPDEFADRDWLPGVPVSGEYPNIIAQTACSMERMSVAVEAASKRGSCGGAKLPRNWNDLTERQQQIYEAHQRMVAEFNRPPSTRQLSEAIGCSHTTVNNDIKAIEQILGTPVPGREASSKREHNSGDMDMFSDP
jgi:hypothetical protein